MAIKYLSPSQLEELFTVWRNHYTASRGGRRRFHGRYWLTFLVLRYTGARIGEVVRINDITDLDFVTGEILVPTLKRDRPIKRLVLVPRFVMSEIAIYLAEYPEMRGLVFALKESNFRKFFKRMAKEAGLPDDLSHPHTLRHSRAIEMLRAGVPVTVVQSLLGHAHLTTTACYLKFSPQDIRTILEEKKLL